MKCKKHPTVLWDVFMAKSEQCSYWVMRADVNPLIGMLMIPKTCAYVWTVLIGYNAMKAEGSAEN